MSRTQEAHGRCLCPGPKEPPASASPNPCRTIPMFASPRPPSLSRNLVPALAQTSETRTGRGVRQLGEPQASGPLMMKALPLTSLHLAGSFPVLNPGPRSPWLGRCSRCRELPESSRRNSCVQAQGQAAARDPGDPGGMTEGTWPHRALSSGPGAQCASQDPSCGHTGGSRSPGEPERQGGDAEPRSGAR